MIVRETAWGRHVIVNAWERAVVLRDGAIVRVAEPGRHRRRRREQWRVLDVRPRLLVIPPQEVLTADGLQVHVNSFCIAAHVRIDCSCNTQRFGFSILEVQLTCKLYGMIRDG